MCIRDSFGLNYFNIFDRNKLYSELNAFGLLFGGIITNVISGVLSDKYEEVNARTKAYICMTMSLLAIPLLTAVF